MAGVLVGAMVGESSTSLWFGGSLPHTLERVGSCRTVACWRGEAFGAEGCFVPIAQRVPRQAAISFPRDPARRPRRARVISLPGTKRAREAETTGARVDTSKKAKAAEQEGEPGATGDGEVPSPGSGAVDPATRKAMVKALISILKKVRPWTEGALDDTRVWW